MLTTELEEWVGRLKRSANPNLKRLGDLCDEVVTERGQLEATLQQLREMLELGSAQANESFESELAAIRDELERVKEERDNARRERDEFGEHNSRVNDELKAFAASPKIDAFEDAQLALERSVEAALALARAANDAVAERSALQARDALRAMADLSWQRAKAAETCADQPQLELVMNAA